jgi:hypothetical protein
MVLTGARRFSWWGQPTVVMGNRGQIELTLDLLHHSKSLGDLAVGVLCSDTITNGELLCGVPVFGGPEAAATVGEAGIHAALVWIGRSLDGHDGAGAINRSFGMDLLQKQFRHLVMLRANKSLPVEHVQVRNLGTMFGIEFFNELLRRENRILKRMLDVVLGSSLLLLTAPVILVCGLLVKLVSRGQIFFRRSARVWWAKDPDLEATHDLLRRRAAA